MKRIIAMIAALAMVLCLAGCNKDGDKDNNNENSLPVNATQVALQSENFSFDLGEATYIFQRYFIDFYNENYQYISYYGIDIEKSLKEQDYTKDVTWFEYFADQAETYMNELLVFCEAAKAEGMTLGEEDNAEIDAIIKEFEDEAEGNGYKSVNALVSEMYGDIVTIDDVRSFVEKEKLAFKYYNALVEGYTFTEEEEDAYLSENPDEFYYVDYVYYIFDEDNDRDAKYNAQELKETADSDAFYAYIEDYEVNVRKLDEEKRVGAKESKYVIKDGEVGAWAFSAEIGDKYVDENGKDGIYTVYMLLSKPAIQEYNVRDIRYICLTKETYQTNEKTKAKAEKILAEWDETEKTSEDFGKLAEVYSEDENSKANGGLYQNVDMSNSILSDEGMKWLFEEGQVGDVKLLKGEGIYYILYIDNIGKAQWRVTADNAMGEKLYAEDSEKMVEAHKVEVFDKVLKKIDK
ncbi:MAG: peptidylprolyl isomerase [Clostridia bacterium]|nr:peptidylprolyl isomerase [Clostridia bacterium]